MENANSQTAAQDAIMRMTAAEREAYMLGQLVARGYTMSGEGPRCCICGKTIPTISTPGGEETGIGCNNPAPIVDDDRSVCCASCNEDYVIPSRIGSTHADAWLLLLVADLMRADGCDDAAVRGVVALADAAIVA